MWCKGDVLLIYYNKSKKSTIMKAKTRIIQISNIAPQATKDQMSTLFGFLGKIEDIRLYPTVWVN